MTDKTPALISVDWGTSSFRAYLAANDGAALAEIPSGEGALSLAPGTHGPYLAERLAAWRQEWPGLPVVLSGMVGSRQGWVEAPYAACPAGAEEIAAATLRVPAPGIDNVWLVPGLSAIDSRGAPDVMRGEEVQILGALAAAGASDGLFVLPGTHSKWARVESGRILGFETFMTGEIFAVLKSHSILGRMMEPSDAAPGAGFARGVAAGAGLEHAGDLLHAAFATRTFGLFGALPPTELADYLSGLLSGAELASGARGAKAATVIGSAALTGRYHLAGAQLGLTLTPAPANCATLGQLEVLRRLRAPA